jgi:hypothetical protein
MNSRLLQAARIAMSDNLTVQPTMSVAGRYESRAAPAWLVPPVVVPLFLVTAVVAFALYRFAHLGPAAFG